MSFTGRPPVAEKLCRSTVICAGEDDMLSEHVAFWGVGLTGFLQELAEGIWILATPFSRGVGRVDAIPVALHQLFKARHLSKGHGDDVNGLVISQPETV